MTFVRTNVQIASNTYYHNTVHETPYFVLFGRQRRLSVDIILGIHEENQAAPPEEFPKETHENLQLGFELARQHARPFGYSQNPSREVAFGLLQRDYTPPKGCAALQTGVRPSRGVGFGSSRGITRLQREFR